MNNNEDIEVKFISDLEKNNFDFDQIIYDLDTKINMLSDKTDNLDYLIAISSGILSGMIDALWVKDINIAKSKEDIKKIVDKFVIKIANIKGCEKKDIKSCVAYLEYKYGNPSDSNYNIYGGTIFHHINEFSHHPTIIGLCCSILTQFTESTYGIEKGKFKTNPINEKGKKYIGKNFGEKIFIGTIYWFFHLISDMAGSKSTAGITGGTGIPGPILALAKEISSLPILKDIKIDDKKITKFIDYLFKNKKTKSFNFDLRGELALIKEINRQAIPIIINETIVRTFYFIRKFSIEINKKNIKKFEDLNKIEWGKILPYKNNTLNRMLVVSNFVFTSVDITDIIINKKNWLCVNYVGVGRFALAIGNETSNLLKIRDIKKIKKMYETLKINIYILNKQKEYQIDFEKDKLTKDQIEILYNIQLYMILNDIKNTNINNQKIISLKKEWLKEFKSILESIYNNNNIEKVKKENLIWYNKKELIEKIYEKNPTEKWFRVILLELMLFQPYIPLYSEKSNKKEYPTKKYNCLKKEISSFNKNSDLFLDSLYKVYYKKTGYIKRLRKSYKEIYKDLSNEKLYKKITLAIITTGTTLIITPYFSTKIAIILTGSKFTGLTGAALSNACLSYLGGGSIASGGFGMIGGTYLIMGGASTLSLGSTALISEGINQFRKNSEKNKLILSAKMLLYIKELYLNDENDEKICKDIYNKCTNKIIDIKKKINELEIKLENLDKEEKVQIKRIIKNEKSDIKTLEILQKYIIKIMNEYYKNKK